MKVFNHGVKIKTYKISKSGDRGFAKISLPKSWMEDVGISIGDFIEVRQDKDRLTLIKAEKPKATAGGVA